MYDGIINPKLKELLFSGEFNWDNEWKIKSGKKTIYKGLVYRDRASIRWVKPPGRIESKKNIEVYCGKLLVITFDLEEYKKQAGYGPEDNVTLIMDYRIDNEVLGII